MEEPSQTSTQLAFKQRDNHDDDDVANKRRHDSKWFKSN